MARLTSRRSRHGQQMVSVTSAGHSPGPCLHRQEQSFAGSGNSSRHLMDAEMQSRQPCSSNAFNAGTTGRNSEQWVLHIFWNKCHVVLQVRVASHSRSKA